MTSIEGRINGQSSYGQTNPNRAAWREEMLDQFLNRMKEHRLPAEVDNSPKIKTQASHKGQYVDLYV